MEGAGVPDRGILSGQTPAGAALIGGAAGAPQPVNIGKDDDGRRA